MRSAITTYRNNLTTNANLIATGTNDDHVLAIVLLLQSLTQILVLVVKVMDLNMKVLYNAPESSVTGMNGLLKEGHHQTQMMLTLL